MWLTLLAAGILAGLVLTHPSERRSLVDLRQDSIVQRPPSAPPPPLVIPVFADHTIQAGLWSTHAQRSGRIAGLDEAMGAGACVLDYDDDGWMDLFVIGGTGERRYYGKQQWWQVSRGNRLYRNLGAYRFADVTEKAKLDTNYTGMGCVAADFDNDGDTDLYITNLGPNELYANNGDATFQTAAAASGTEGDAREWSLSAVVADYDRDGRLDLYVTNYIAYRRGAATREDEAGFRNISKRELQPQFFDSQANRLYRNLGALRFEDVTRSTQVGNPSGRSVHASWVDIDQDHRPDLYVANDVGSPDKIFLNRDGGAFVDATAELGFVNAAAATSIQPGDLDNDGVNELLLGTRAGTVVQLLRRHNKNDAYLFTEQARDAFHDIELSSASHTWGVGLHDFNNDGTLDLFAANGLVTPDADAHYKVTTGQPNQLWLNHKSGRFREASGGAGIALRDQLSSRGAVFADYDNDGDIDIFINNNNELGQLLVNQHDRGHWLGVGLRTRTNTEAIGAQIRIHTARGVHTRTLTRGGLMSASDPRLHIGLGQTPGPVDVAVTWPDGERFRFTNVAVDRYIALRQGSPTVEVKALPNVVPSNPVPWPALVREEPEYRTAYIAMLADAMGVDHAMRQIDTFIADESEAVRLATVQLLHEAPHDRSIPYFISLLEDPAAAVRQQAVLALARSEQELVFRWLVRATRDPDAAVRLAAVAAFTALFHKEEALVVRKGLAVTRLIELLHDDEAAVREAAAAALGEAEHVRGVGPLIALLDDPNETTKVVALRALGQIRERRAAAAVTDEMRKPRVSPAVLAVGLVALRRFDDPQLADQVQHAFTRPHLAENDQRQLASALLRGNDPVFDRDTLARFVGQPLALGEQGQHSARIRALGIGGGPLAASLIRRDMASTGHAPLLVACRALAATSAVSAQELLIRCASLTPADRAAVMQAFHPAAQTKLPISSLHAFLGINALDSSPDLQRLRPYAHLLDLSAFSDAALLSWSQDVQLNDAQRVIVLDTLGRRPAPLAVPFPASLMRDPDRRVRHAALRSWRNRVTRFQRFANTPAVLLAGLEDDATEVWRFSANTLLARVEPWAIRLQEELLLDPKRPLVLRTYLLDTFAADGSKVSLVLKLCRRRHDPMGLAAMAALRNYPAAQAKNYAWRVLNNPAEALEARFAAARALFQVMPTAVLAVLKEPQRSHTLASTKVGSVAR